MSVKSGSIDEIDVFTSKDGQCCVKTSPGRVQHIHLFAPNRDTTTDPSTDTTKVLLGKPMCFTRVTYTNTGDRLLTGA